MNTHKAQFDPHAYSITVRRATVDGELLFIATVAEIPSVSAIAETYADAYDIVVDAIVNLEKSASDCGRVFPEPAATSSIEHSGRITLRMPPWLHTQLERESQRDGMSLNQTVITLLASRVATQDIVREVTTAIGAVVKVALASSSLTSSERSSTSGHKSSVSYSATNSISMPETENEKWITRH